MVRSYKIYIDICLFCFLGGCEHDYGNRCLETIQKISRENHLTSHVFQTKNHKIFALLGPQKQGRQSHKRSSDLHIYIEGDGLAWSSPYRISRDPTPIEPTGLTLAMADQTGATKVYLGRPGHYLYDDRLGLYSWTDARFSEETIETYIDIIDRLQVFYPRSKISLFGYSGGALISLLTAAKRYQQGKRDIRQVVTFAGVLDHEAWSEFHDVSPLNFSLNSSAYLEALKHIPQRHYSGLKDTIVPLRVSQEYMISFQDRPQIHLVTVPHVNHWEGWENYWAQESLNWKVPESF